ncbi:MFS transporter [Azospirillum thermophilum]|uniref:MFS transporter n=1 Tax=Azospirillum thermophilum TaxID=2202148 RepID=A0A2S2CWF8_9PROT|nr:MFS transporter [Azospirillum thermophilum]AWK88809.1 MFS transporter [Azospirillum thermophilum]
MLHAMPDHPIPDPAAVRTAPPSAPPSAPPPGDGLPVPQRYWAVLTMTVALVMAVLDGAIANIALPTIEKSFAISAADSIWVVNAYQMAVTVSLFPFASLGDIVGYRRVYWGGLLVFTLASAACALSDTLLTLTLARVLQGFGGAGIMSVNIALVRYIYPQAQLGRGVGYNAMIVAVTSAAGPSIAALILSVASWQWLFAVNVPLGLVALVIAARSLPDSPPSGHRFDFVGAGLSALTIGLLITGFKGVDGSQPGWMVGLQLAAALAVGTVLVRRSQAQAAPLVPVDLLRRPIFALTVVTSVCSFATQAIAFVAMPFYFEDVIGRSLAESGLLMTPWPLAVAVVAPVAGRLADRYDPSVLSAVGLTLLALGMASLVLLPAAPHSLDVAWRMALAGFGFGLFQTPNNKILVSSAPKERSGGASGIQSTARLLGQTLGAAAVGLIFGLLPKDSGTLVATALGAVLSAVAGVSSVLRRRERGRPA